jgi:hypothetical protein
VELRPEDWVLADLLLVLARKLLERRAEHHQLVLHGLQAGGLDLLAHRLVLLLREGVEQRRRGLGLLRRLGWEAGMCGRLQVARWEV